MNKLFLEYALYNIYGKLFKKSKQNTSNAKYKGIL